MTFPFRKSMGERLLWCLMVLALEVFCGCLTLIVYGPWAALFMVVSCFLFAIVATACIMR